MPSWDDFRIVKAIADCGSLAEAAKALRINQSTVFRKLGQIETELDARLFKRSRSALTLTPCAEIMARTGLQFLTDMVDGKLPQPPICATLGFRLTKVADGYARFDGVPEFRHYNPIGTVHGGFAATLLDSALGCAIFTTL